MIPRLYWSSTFMAQQGHWDQAIAHRAIEPFPLSTLLRIHILAIDYRGFGDYSTGWPSESGLLTDALTAFTWATDTAGISSSRIVIFAQSVGTAAALSLTQHLASQQQPTFVRGIILVAPFSDVESLTATYRLAGTVPLLSPVARFPTLLKRLNSFIADKWDSKARVASLIKAYGTTTPSKYHIEIIHAEDDYDIEYTHSEQLFWHAVNAASERGVSYEELEDIRASQGNDLGEAGRVTEWRTDHGLIRQHILKHGLHDRVMGYPVVSMAIARAFDNTV